MSALPCNLSAASDKQGNKQADFFYLSQAGSPGRVSQCVAMSVAVKAVL